MNTRLQATTCKGISFGQVMSSSTGTMASESRCAQQHART